MNIEILPDSLLNGEFLHCRPVEGGPITEAAIAPLQKEGLSTSKIIIVCGKRQPCSKCTARVNAGVEDTYCQYYKGDGYRYQIIGRGMDRKK